MIKFILLIYIVDNILNILFYITDDLYNFNFDFNIRKIFLYYYIKFCIEYMFAASYVIINYINYD